MAKKIKTIVKIQLNAGKANPAPPVGTALGPQGINIGDFCAKFNEATKDKMGDIIPTEITIYEDRTFTFICKTPPASDLLKKMAKIEKGSSNALKQKVGKITKAQIREIAQRKMPDLNTDNVEQAMKIIEGTARQMGLEVKE